MFIHLYIFGSCRVGVKIFGNSIEAARIFSLVCVCGAACLLAGMIRNAGGSIVTAVLSALFLLLSPIGIYAATIARPYALALLFIIGATWAAYASLRIRPPKNSSRLKNYFPLICGFLAGLAVLSNYFAAIFTILLGLWITVFSIGPRSWRTVLNFAIGAVAPLMISAWMLTGQIGSRPNQFASFEGLSLLPNIFLIALKQLTPQNFLEPSLEPYLSQIALIMMSLAIVIGAVVAWFDTKSKADQKTLWPLIAYLGIGYIIGLFTVSYLKDYNLTYARYTYVAIPFLASLAAVSCSFGFKKWRVGVFLLALPILVLQIYWVYQVQVKSNTGQEWRNLAAFTKNQLPGDDTLILINVGYGRGVPSSMIYELPNNAKVRMVTGKTARMKLLNDVKQ